MIHPIPLPCAARLCEDLVRSAWIGSRIADFMRDRGNFFADQLARAALQRLRASDCELHSRRVVTDGNPHKCRNFTGEIVPTLLRLTPTACVSLSK